MDAKMMFALIDQRKEELFELLCRLIQINSESFGVTGNEEECARFIHELCLGMGLECDLYSPMEVEGFTEHPDYRPGRNLENRYNVTARFPGAEKRDELMLMGHIDTVKIGEASNWNVGPLSGEIRDGKIFGRGACDDKYALATVLFLIKLLREEGFTPKANLLFTAYCDEEHGGSHGALAAVLRYPCPHIVNMDGRENQIWHAASGGGVVRYLFHTRDMVDSAKLTAAAIPVVMEAIDSFAERRRMELEANRVFAGTVIPKTALRYTGVRAGNDGTDLGDGEVSFVYYTDRTKEEIDAEFAGLEKCLEERLAPLGIIGDGFRPKTRYFHYAHGEPDGEDIKMMLEASREATGKEPIICGSGLSDFSVISKYGSSNAFAFGAGRDFSKEGGTHQPNEYMECDRLVEYAKTIAAYVIKVLG